jgi:hypothetical protein
MVHRPGAYAPRFTPALYVVKKGALERAPRA